MPGGAPGTRLESIPVTQAGLLRKPPVSIPQSMLAAGAAISKRDCDFLCAGIPTLSPIFISLSPMVLDSQPRKSSSGQASNEIAKANQDVSNTEENSSRDKFLSA